METVEKLSSDFKNTEYNCAIGYSVQDGTKSYAGLLNEADANMYLEKKKYYEKHERRR